MSKINELANKYKEYVINLRREFHMHPELGLQEFRTSARVKEELDKMGISYIASAGTGVVATIEGSREGKTIALRADMDALQVCEMNDIPYKSQNEGVMHACGHDGHTAMLLGAARVLCEMRDEIEGTIKLVFQPSEESVQGAKLMIEEGILEGVDGAFAIHLWADMPLGRISLEEGPRMASADIFRIIVKGRGGHGSMPHQGVDAVVAASAIVMNLQSIASRETTPMEPTVVSVGTMRAGTRFNVIAKEAVLEGTTRSFNTEIRKSFPVMMERIAKSTAEVYRAEALLEYTFGTAPTINDPECAKLGQGSVEKLFGRDTLMKQEKVTGGEDFAFFLEKVPGAIAFLGARNEDNGAAYPHHHERFNIDEDSLEIGTALYVQYALDFLSE